MRQPPRPHPKPEPRARDAGRGAAAPGQRLTKGAAEAVALDAFAFLAADLERAERFLSLAGIAPGELRAAAGLPGFLAGVLDHLAEDEALLLNFAEARDLDPAGVMAARRALGGSAALETGDAGV